MKKKVLYYGISILAVLTGAALSIAQIVNPENNTMFLFGILWLWQGTALLFGLDPNAEEKFPRKIQIGMGINDVVFGGAWLAISMTKASGEILPLLIMGIPVVIITFILSRYKKSIKIRPEKFPVLHFSYSSSSGRSALWNTY